MYQSCESSCPHRFSKCTKKWFLKSGSTVLKSWKVPATVAKAQPTTVGRRSLLSTANCRAGRAQTAELSWTFTPLTSLASSARSTAEQKNCHSNSTLIFQSSLLENSQILFSLSLCFLHCSCWEFDPFLFASLQISSLICKLKNRYCFDRSTLISKLCFGVRFNWSVLVLFNTFSDIIFVIDAPVDLSFKQLSVFKANHPLFSVYSVSLLFLILKLICLILLSQRYRFCFNNLRQILSQLKLNVNCVQMLIFE